jgi:hypothetical protein
VHHGRHFGRTIHALCNVNNLLTNGLQLEVTLEDEPLESLSAEYVFSRSFFCEGKLHTVSSESERSIASSSNFSKWCQVFTSVLWPALKRDSLEWLNWYVTLALRGSNALTSACHHERSKEALRMQDRMTRKVSRAPCLIGSRREDTLSTLLSLVTSR